PVPYGDAGPELDGRAHQQRPPLGDRRFAVARRAEDEQGGSRDHGAPDLLDHVRFELEVAERFPKRVVGYRVLVRDLPADEPEIVIERHRAGADVPGAYRCELGGPVTSGAG